MKTRNLLTTAILATTFIMVPQAEAVLITQDTSNVVNIPGLTGFRTTGADMDGLLVTATFTTGFSQTLSWTANGASSGGVTGANWSLSVDGDTFNDNAWTLFNDNIFVDTAVFPGALRLANLRLDGSQSLTVFDRTFGGLTGTDGSALGKDIDFGSRAHYSNVVAVTPNAFVGDLFHTLDISFDNALGLGGFTFSQDTDNDSRYTQGVPEPGVIALLATGLLGMAVVRRRRKDV